MIAMVVMIGSCAILGSFAIVMILIAITFRMT